MSQEQHQTLPAADDTNKREYIYVRYEDTDDDEMDIYDIIDLCLKGVSILKRYIALLLVFLVLGCLVGAGKYFITKEEEFYSSALLFVDLKQDALPHGDNVDETPRISMLANSFSQIIRSESVIYPIAKQHLEKDQTLDDKVKDLNENINVWVPGGSQTIRISVTDKDAQVAQEICETLVEQGIAAVNSSTDYAAISIVSPASEGIDSTDAEDDSDAKSASAVSSIGSMAAIFVVIAILIIAVRELAAAYKVHNAAKEQEQ